MRRRRRPRPHRRPRARRASRSTRPERDEDETRARAPATTRAALGVDELRQECEEEERRLRVEDVDDGASHERPAERLAPRLDLRRGVALEQLPDAEVDEVRSAGVLHDAERRRRRDDQGRQTDGRRERCERASRRGCRPPTRARTAALLGALRDDVEHRRPRNRAAARARQPRRPPTCREARDRPRLPFCPCAATTSRRSAAR